MSTDQGIFACKACGYEKPIWFGRCPDCGEWGSSVAVRTLGPQPEALVRVATQRRVFIVYGHDDAAKYELALLVNTIGLQPLLLDEQPNQGLTVIEKVEKNGRGVNFALVLLTPDDVALAKRGLPATRERARQNVVFELGFFVGMLGRGRVCVIRKGDVEIPSDLQGIVYVPMDDAGAWRLKVCRELKAAGLDIDVNLLA